MERITKAVASGAEGVGDMVKATGGAAVSIVGTAVSTPIKIVVDSVKTTAEGIKSVYHEAESLVTDSPVLLAVGAAAAYFFLAA